MLRFYESFAACFGTAVLAVIFASLVTEYRLEFEANYKLLILCLLLAFGYATFRNVVAHFCDPDEQLKRLSMRVHMLEQRLMQAHPELRGETIDAFECPKCNMVSTTLTPDGNCPYCHTAVAVD